MTVLPAEPFLVAFAVKGDSWNRVGRDLYQAFLRSRRLYGGLPPLVADRLAIRVLGAHPSEIWGDEWWRAAEADLEAVSA